MVFLYKKRVSGDSFDVAETTVESWMERLWELRKGYELKDIWNIDEVNVFLKLFQRKVLPKSGEKLKVVRGRIKW